MKLNGTHANAKKYLGETLLALGRNYEESSKFEEARKAYIDCLKINPHHQEALASLEYLKTKLNAKRIVEPAELELPRKLRNKLLKSKETYEFLHSTQHRINSAFKRIEKFLLGSCRKIKRRVKKKVEERQEEERKETAQLDE